MPDNPTAIWIIIIPAAAIVIAAWVRFWTEGGFWQAIHTGRAFMLQATTVSAGLGISHLDQVKKAATLTPFLPNPMPKPAQDALTPTLSAVLGTPELIFLAALVFLVLYIMTGYHEHNYLQKIGNPPYPRKYTNGVNQEPTTRYKCFISVCMWFGLLCLLSAFYFLGGHRRGPVWYTLWIVVPAHVLCALTLSVGPWLSKLIRGTDAGPQTWDVARLGGEQR